MLLMEIQRRNISFLFLSLYILNTLSPKGKDQLEGGKTACALTK